MTFKFWKQFNNSLPVEHILLLIGKLKSKQKNVPIKGQRPQVKIS